MKVYTKNQIKTNDGKLTGSVMWFMHDSENDQTLMIKNFDPLYKFLPYSISGTSKFNCFDIGNEIIDEIEFHEVYDKAIDSLQNYVP